MNAAASQVIVIPRNVVIPEVDTVLTDGVSGVLEVAREFKIDSREMYDLAVGELREVISRKNRLEEARQKLKAPVLLTGRTIDGFFNPLITTLEEAERTYKRGMLAFDQAEKRRRDEEQRKAEQAAAAERKRIQEEADRVAEETRQREMQEAEALAADLRANGEEEAAEQAIADGQAAADYAAEEITQAAVAEAQTVTAIITAPTEVARSGGTSVRQKWVAEVTDLDKVIAAAAAGNTIARSLLCVDDTVKGQHARSLKTAFNDVPGIRCWDDGQLALRGAR